VRVVFEHHLDVINVSRKAENNNDEGGPSKGSQGFEGYVDTAESDHTGMYLKAIRYIRERGEEPKVSYIAKLLNIRQPSVVEMLRKLDEAKMVGYKKGSIVGLKARGERIGGQMIVILGYSRC